MNILIYTQFNSRSRDTESVMEAFVKEGHQVFLLTQGTRGEYHAAAEAKGVKAFAHDVPKSRFRYFIRHAQFLAQFCKQHAIDLVYAHLENAGLSAVMAQYRMKAKVVVCRHIVDEAALLNSKRFILQNKIVYRLARTVVVVSQRAKDYMVNHEGISASKIHVINLGYNFDLYSKPDPAQVSALKTRYQSDLLMLTACRLLEAKRPMIALELTEALRRKGISARLMILGDGPQRQLLEETIRQKGLEEYVHLPGHQKNIIDYIAACDLLVHPSILDSSSVIIKEAGLLRKAVLACSDVGDVNEYLRTEVNSLLVQKENPLPGMIAQLEKWHGQKENLALLGDRLHNEILQRFSIDSVLPQYHHLHQTLHLS